MDAFITTPVVARSVVWVRYRAAAEPVGGAIVADPVVRIVDNPLWAGMMDVSIGLR